MEEPRIKQFICSLHKSEPIRKICSDPRCVSPICCVDCALDEQGTHKSHKRSLLSVINYIDYAAEEFQTLKKIKLSKDPPPKEYISLSTMEDEILQKLTQNINKEKKLLSDIIDKIIRNFNEVCMKLKQDVYKELDEQINILKANYGIYKTKLKQYYGPKNEINLSKNDIIQKINGSTNLDELNKLIKNFQLEFLKKEPEDKNTLQRRLSTINNEFYEMTNLLKKLPECMPKPKLTTNADNIPRTIERLTLVLKDELRLKNKIMKFDVLNVFQNSNIINPEEFELLRIWLNKFNANFTLVYRGTTDGFKAQIFHQKVKSIKSTIIIMHSNHDKRFGGYIDQDWDGDDLWKFSNNAFLFSFNEKEKYSIKLAPYAIYTYKLCGPVFGNGHDIFIADHANIQNINYSKFGSAYDSKGKCNVDLVGGYNFTLREIEAYRIDQHV